VSTSAYQIGVIGMDVAELSDATCASFVTSIIYRPIVEAHPKFSNEYRAGWKTASGVRRDKAALSSGCKSHPATAPAGSNRSSYGGNEVAEAFG
jgi:hypothetical protein